MTNVLIVGAGSIGKAILGELIRNKTDTTITIMDKNRSKLNTIRRTLNTLTETPKLNLLTDISKLHQNVDVVINATNPENNIKLMKFALKKKADYIDLGSNPFKGPGISPDSLFDSQIALTDRFKQSKKIAITNTGAAPGLSDLIIKRNIVRNGLHTANIGIYFYQEIISDRLISSWSPEILLFESIMPGTTYKQGQIQSIIGKDKFREVQFPRIGKKNVILFNTHPELKTVPFYLKEEIDSIQVGGNLNFNGLELPELILELIQQNLFKKLTDESIFEKLCATFDNKTDFVEYYKKGKVEFERITPLITIEDVENRIAVHTSLTIQHANDKNPFANATSFITSILPSVLTEELLLEEISEKGVIAPAGLSDSERILLKCSRRGLALKTKKDRKKS